MPLYLTVTSGPKKGQKMPVSNGLTVGRAAQFKLNDSKISSLHAVVEMTPEGQFFLKDNKSTNGIRVEGQKVEAVLLTKGVVIQLGRTFLEVVEEAEPPPPSVEIPPVSWDEFLSSYAEDLKRKVKNKPKPLSPFQPALDLKFIRGLQVDTCWTLGYGPRTAGAKSFDLPILEPDAPEVCFELVPHKSGVQFKTPHPEKVRLNGKPTSSEILKTGDKISVGDTCIEVEYLS